MKVPESRPVKSASALMQVRFVLLVSIASGAGHAVGADSDSDRISTRATGDDSFEIALEADAAIGDREQAERMAFDCLRGDRRLECLNEKGFRCASVGEPSRNGYSCYLSVGGNCYRKRFRLEENGWSSNDDWQSGACEDTFEPALGPGVRERYDNTNAPDKLLFKMFVRRIFAESVDFLETLESAEFERSQAGLKYVEPGLTGKMDAADVVRYFARRFPDIEDDVEEFSKALLCEGTRPRYPGAENFVVFNQLDEVRLNVYERHLLIARAELQAGGLFDLDKALHDFPGSFVSVSVDHEAARDGSVASIYEHATRLCESPWGHQFSSSGPADEAVQ